MDDRVEMSARDFLLHRFGTLLEEGEQIEVRPIHATSGARHPRKFVGTVEEAVEWIEGVPAGFEIYVGVNTRHRSDGTKAGVLYLYCLWCDVDDKHFGGSKQASWEAIMGFGLLPSLVVRTGNGWQVYWELEEKLPASVWTPKVEEYVQRLQFTLGGLDNTQDVSRIYRVPGTKNYKDPSNPKEVYVAVASDRRYTLTDFDEHLVALPPERPPQRELDAIVPQGERPTPAEIKHLLSFIDPCLPQDQLFLIWGAVAYYYPEEDGLRMVDEWCTEAREKNGQACTPASDPGRHFRFKRQTGKVATLGTLVHYAKLGGYQPPKLPLNRIVGAKKRQELDNRLDDLPNPTYDELPYWLQRVYDHLGPLTDGLIRDLTTVVSITSLSCLWRGKWFENLALNLFCNLLMEQGSGKSRVTQELEMLVKSVPGIGQDYYTTGSPQGMYKALNRSESKALYASLDEFGDFLAGLKSDHMATARGTLNSLYDARSVHYQLSRESITIENPYLTLVATTTPKMFLLHVNEQDLEGGFASRFWYIAPKWANSRMHGGVSRASRELLAQELAEHRNSLESVTEVRFDCAPGSVPAAYAQYEREMGVGSGEWRDFRDAIEKPQSPKGRFLARVKKVAGNLELLERHPQIDGHAVVVRNSNLDLAITLVRRTQVYQEMVMEMLQSTDDERLLVTMERVIGKGSPAGLSRAQIMQGCHCKAADLNRLLPYLKENGTVEEYYDNGRPLYRTAGSGQWPVKVAVAK